MTALKYNIRLNQNETSSLIFPVLDEFGAPVNITGWTAEAQIRSGLHNTRHDRRGASWPQSTST